MTAPKQAGHTPEPWGWSDGEGNDVHDDYDAVNLYGLHGQGGILGCDYHRPRLANARRIVACVNAMAGIEDPAAFVEAHRSPADITTLDLDTVADAAKLVAIREAEKDVLDAVRTYLAEYQARELSGYYDLARAMTILDTLNPR